MPLLHRNLELLQIDLSQSPFVDDGIARHAHSLLAVRGEVLQTCSYTGPLHSSDERRPHPAGQVRILAVVFEASAAKRGALCVDSRSEDDCNVFGDALLTKCLTHHVRHILVPAGCHKTCRRIACRRNRFLLAEVVGSFELLSKPMGTVGDHDRRKTCRWYSGYMPGIAACHQGDLLIKAHPPYDFVYVFHLQPPLFKGQVFRTALLAHRWHPYPVLSRCACA